MKKTRFTEPQIMAVLREAEGGVAVPAVCRAHGISIASFYKWRAKYGGMDASMMSQMKAMDCACRAIGPSDNGAGEPPAEAHVRGP